MSEAKAWHVDVTEVEKRRIFSAVVLSFGTALAIASTAPVSDKTRKILAYSSELAFVVSIASALSGMK